MDENDMLFKMGRLHRYIGHARAAQAECAEGDHECHWTEMLESAEDLAEELLTEFNLRQGERLVAQSPNLLEANTITDSNASPG